MVKTKLFIGVCCFIAAISAVQANNSSNHTIDKQFWQNSADITSAQISVEDMNSNAKAGLYFNVDISLLEQQLLNHDSVLVDLPLPDGSYVTFKLTSSQVMHPTLAAKYPTIRTFSGHQVGNRQNHGHFDITPHGFHGVFTYNNEQIFIDPSSRKSNRHYHNYYRKDAQPIEQTSLSKRLPPRKSVTNNFNEIARKTASAVAKTTVLTTYKLAIATTGEYSTFHGGTKESTLAALVTLVNRLNDVYQRDLSMTFELVADNDNIIFLNSNTDPFENTDNDIDLNANVINGAIGVENYDIGHLVGTGGGGLAGFGVVCSAGKADGVTGSNRPTSDSFYIDFVAHEVGHQFRADHTFNGGQGACDGNRVSSSAYEPGSASTIMGYAGICGSQNIQNNSDPYFHIHSIDQIRSFVAPLVNCGTTMTIANDAPTADAGADYIIPARTPFTLVGSATDPDGDSLSYNWEQFDLGAQSNNAGQDSIDDGFRPLFRTYDPTDNANRTLPKLADILANRVSYGEALPTMERELNFRLVVRDNQNNLVDDAMKINVVSVAQGFSVNDISNWNSYIQTVSWHTAGTENAPVSCAVVDIMLSTDSGATYAQALSTGTANDGSQEIRLPNLTSSKARVKITCNDNIFFTISTTDFDINVNDAPTKPVFIGQANISTNEDSNITLSVDMLNFENNPPIETLQAEDGENYTLDGLTITPSTNFNGNIMVNMTATSSNLVSDVFQVQVDIISVNDIPTAIADSAIVAQDSGATEIDVVLNDSDIEDNSLILKSATTAGSGNVQIINNKISYTPAAGFSGSEVVNYIIEDLQQASASADLSITITAAPVVPPTTTPPVSNSSGGGVYYLLMIMMLTLTRFRLISQGYHHE
jgi:hypothetical protein